MKIYAYPLQFGSIFFVSVGAALVYAWAYGPTDKEKIAGYEAKVSPALRAQKQQDMQKFFDNMKGLDPAAKEIIEKKFDGSLFCL